MSSIFRSASVLYPGRFHGNTTRCRCVGPGVPDGGIDDGEGGNISSAMIDDGYEGCGGGISQIPTESVG